MLPAAMQEIRLHKNPALDIVLADSINTELKHAEHDESSRQ